MKKIIGIIGPIGAGKDTAADYLSKQLGIPSYQISSPLQEICLQQGIEPNRTNLIELGTNLAKSYGDGYLAKYIVERSPNFFVIVGMRQLGQITYLKQHADFILTAVDASLPIRFKRAAARDKLGEAKTIEQFEANELKENSPPRAQRLFECIKLADYTLSNNGTFADLERKLDRIMTKERLVKSF